MKLPHVHCVRCPPSGPSVASLAAAVAIALWLSRGGNP